MSTNNPNTQSGRDHLLSDKQYFILNALAVLILPAAGSLYFALAGIWHFPAAEQVVGSIVVLDTFLGVIVKVGEMSYNQSDSRYAGALNVSENPDKTVYSLELHDHPDTLKEKDKVTFKVNTNLPLPSGPTPSPNLSPPSR